MRTWQSMRIPTSQIEVDPLDPTERTIDEETCQSLARSIEFDGLLHALLVKPQGDGRYKLIAGRHRLRAVSEYLHWTEVDCKVVDDVDDETAHAMTLAENLFVQPLEDFQLLKALARWWEIYKCRNPGAAGRGSHMKRECSYPSRGDAPLHSSTSDPAEHQSEQEERTHRSEVDESRDPLAIERIRPGQKPFPFYRAIQSQLGVSSPTAQRFSRVARNLTPEQIDVLDDHGVSKADIHALAGLGSEEAIQSAIDLIASGDDPKKVTCTAAKRVRSAAERLKAARSNGGRGSNAIALVNPSRLSEQTDEEWLAANCDRILKLLKYKAAFKRDAILYRRVQQTLVNIRSSTKKALAEAKGPAGGNGGFFGSVVRVVKAAHPSNWLVCGGCNGTGYVMGRDKDGKEANQKCTACNGAAYKLKLED